MNHREEQLFTQQTPIEYCHMLDAGNQEGNLEEVALELSPAWLKHFQ